MGDAQFNGTPAQWDALVQESRAQRLATIRELADRAWEGCHGCDDTDKSMWTNGFIEGYLTALHNHI
jgi:hypothetical protein